MSLRTLLLAALLLGTALGGCATPTDGTPGAGATTTTTSTPPTAAAPTGTGFEDDFDAAGADAAPEGWEVESGAWTVVEDDAQHARVLRQSDRNASFPTIVAEEAGTFGDFEADVQFKVLEGEKAQAGGIAFRFVDEDNFYVVRWNGNEGTWNLFRTLDGKRQKFAPTTEEPLGALGEWLDLHVEAQGNHVTATSGGVTVIDYTEEAEGAPAVGHVGLWTKDDSIVLFDGFEVEPR